MAADVAVKAIDANPVLNGNIVTHVPKAAIDGTVGNRAAHVDTGPTDDRGPAPDDDALLANYDTRFDQKRYYTGDLDT